jgi:hypothetical protein
MLELQGVYTDSGKKYTFNLDELPKDVLSDEQLAKIKKIILKEIQKL